MIYFFDFINPQVLRFVIECAVEPNGVALCQEMSILCSLVRCPAFRVILCPHLPGFDLKNKKQSSSLLSDGSGTKVTFAVHKPR